MTCFRLFASVLSLIVLVSGPLAYSDDNAEEKESKISCVKHCYDGNRYIPAGRFESANTDEDALCVYKVEADASCRVTIINRPYIGDEYQPSRNVDGDSHEYRMKHDPEYRRNSGKNLSSG